MPRRIDKTLMDYVAIAISPALIMVMVGTLVYFLLAVFYMGQFSERLHFIFAMFVLGAVMVARISIEESNQYATVYATPLAMVTGLAVLRFVDMNLLISLGLVVAIWWFAHKLTRNCTLIDEKQDVSGEGLLQNLGIDEGKVTGIGETQQPMNGDPCRSQRDLGEQATGWWKWHMERQRKPRAPGLWVIYFSLIALPIFGFGQWLIPNELRPYTFFLLIIHLASGLVLLSTTSFLGLRRYLRQRRVEMPAEMAAVWIGMGGTLIVILLVFCTLLPRPGAGQWLARESFLVGLLDKLQSSRHGIGTDGPEDTKASRTRSSSELTEGSADESSDEKPHENRDGQKTDSASQKPEGSIDGNRSARDGSGEVGRDKRQRGKTVKSETDSVSHANDLQSSRGAARRSVKDHDRRARRRAADESKATSSRLSFSFSTPQIIGILKWAFYIFLAAISLYLLWRKRVALRDSWEKLLEEFRLFMRRLFGSAAACQNEVTDPEELPAPTAPKFSAYADPFSTSLSARASPQQLVRYTFEAMEAWGRENGAPREDHHTPLEFARLLALQHATLGESVSTVAELYGWLAYGDSQLPSSTVEQLRRIWSQLRPISN